MNARYLRFCKAYDVALTRVMRAKTRRELTRVYRWCQRLERENPTFVRKTMAQFTRRDA